MPAFRIFFGILICLVIQPALAQGTKDPAQCQATMTEYVERLELYAAGVEEVVPLLADARRKGNDAELTAHLARLLKSNRDDGVKDMLRRIEEEYVACGKGLFAPELIARVDAARPWAAVADPELDVEEPPRLEVADIASSFVPYETTDDGRCTGPYIDLAIKVTNSGGTFPRQVDLDLRRRTWPESDGWAYIGIALFFTYDNGETGQQQVDVFATDLPNGVIAKGAAVTIPLRVRIFDNRKRVTITGSLSGGDFAVAENEVTSGKPFSFEADIPIWDLFTVSTATVSGSNMFAADRSISTAVKADIINRGGPTPGPVLGYFTVRSATDGTTFATLEGKTAGPVDGGGGVIRAGKKVPTKLARPIEVEAALRPLCPDGSFGILADGNRADNDRVLTER